MTRPSDTEVVLHMLRRCGFDALNRLRSTFALALWDDEERTLLGAQVELRDPFVDVDLWNAVSNLAADIRYERGKRLLGRAFPELPSWLFDGPKKGFALPWNDWFSSVLQSERNLVPEAVRPMCRTWYQKMAWVSFVAWRHQIGI